MLVLGIESSCDETAAAVVTDEGDVISDAVASQIKEHAVFGGVVPEIASRAHTRAVIPMIRQALAAIPSGLDGIDAVAFTQGPGLIGALLVGVQTGKAIALAKDLPLVGVDHLLGHLFAIFLKRDKDTVAVPEFPYVALLVSGGHTALYDVHSINDVRLLGQTRDDAAGEAYDKVAKLLGLGYPGGPILDRMAPRGNPAAIPLPRPMAASKI
ncbi:MAG: tRNA (adenosine(37)-N6)-threonylcarbamoyltransferase complex transferase subunit TsaD [Myxococcales bacterium]|nr:MAG: tRNA (adenosine(37)-N6)-threonylcarbamoyltransferase complex transferase subunit TsaD [Myxococcales bacterium]